MVSFPCPHLSVFLSLLSSSSSSWIGAGGGGVVVFLVPFLLPDCPDPAVIERVALTDADIDA